MKLSSKIRKPTKPEENPRKPTRHVISENVIRSYCEGVAQEFHTDKIVLFGSYAYGQPDPESDVDLMVIMPFRGNDVAKAIQIRSRFSAPFALDLLVRKPKFIEARLKERDMFIELVMTRGEVMYHRMNKARPKFDAHVPAQYPVKS